MPSACNYDSKRQERLAKEEKLNHLRDHLKSRKPVTMKSVYFVSLPTEEVHHSTHPTRGANMMAQRVNPHIAARISELVGEGMTDPYEVSKVLKHYVTTVLCTSNNNPDPDDRAYYPTVRDLRNHIKGKEGSKTVQTGPTQSTAQIEEWEKSLPESNFHFQPFIKVEQCEENLT